MERVGRLGLHLRPAGSGSGAAAAADGPAAATDTMGNVWTLNVAEGSLICQPSAFGLSSPDAQQPAVAVPLPAASHAMLPTIAFDAGNHLWLLDAGSQLWRLRPGNGRTAEAVGDGWALFDPDRLPAGPVVGLEVLPTGHVAAIVGRGGSQQPFAVDIEAGGVCTAAPAAPLLEQHAASRWDGSAAPRLPFGNHDIHARELGGKVYVCAGLASGGFPVQYRVYDELLSWDGVSEEWVIESKMPERRAYGGMATLDGELWYCSGAAGREGHSGSGDDRPPVRGTWIYNPATEAWREGPPMHTPRVETAAFTAAGRVYVFGGSTRSLGGETFDVVESIGPGDDAWKVEPLPMPVGLRQFGGCVIDDKIYLVVSSPTCNCSTF